tara:strand:- start:539 stop:2059 length:1521 start_codon:yes stop_codon:yes gene_type:complete
MHPSDSANDLVLPASEPDSDATRTLAANPWPLWQRIGFRYAMLHSLLYVLPLPFLQLINMVRSYLHQLDGWWREPTVEGGVAGNQTWMGEFATWIGEEIVGGTGDQRAGLSYITKWWREAVDWTHEHLTTGLPVHYQMSGSGDTGFAFTKLLVLVCLAAGFTAIWSLLDRSRSYPRLGRWVHLIVRFYVGYYMLVYGGIKMYAGQFMEPSIAGMSREIGDKSPMGMVWTFMGSSKPYEVFAGIGELVGGFLLFHRRTALLGCCVTIAVMTNVCALNWLYDVPVKLFSTHLLVFAMALLLPWWPSLWSLFVRNRSPQPIDMSVTQWRWLRRTLMVIGCLWIGGMAFQMHQNNSARLDDVNQRYAKPALYGRWDVEKMIHDGVELPISDANRWQFLAIDRGTRAWSRAAMGQVFSWICTEDLANNQVMMKVVNGKEESWTVAQGTKSIEAPNPNPVTIEDFRKPVNVERRTLVLRGVWQGKPLELHTIEHVFNLHRGFHWVQEMPFNR